MSSSLTTRRLGFTLLLAILLAGAIGLIDGDAAALIFLPCWLGLFFAWPYISRKLGFNFPKAPAPLPPRRRTEWGRLFATAVLAFGLSYLVALAIDPALFGLSLLFLWVTLYYAWPLLTKRLPHFGFAKTFSAASAPKRPLWRRMVWGSLSTVGGVALAIFLLMASTVMVPLDLCHRRAQKVHDSIHVGMTVAQVLQTAKDCDAFYAYSDFPYDAKANDDNIPSMMLNGKRDGTYHTYDSAAQQNVELSEAEALEQLHAKLHDGYKWQFRYTYFNVTPEHVSFSVAFGPDGRVSKVTPVYGWD